MRCCPIISKCGGYRKPEIWLSEGWDTAQREGWDAPLYWERRGDGWWSMTLSGMRPVAAAEPVCHVSLFEADAFARWSRARLPTEQEWEIAAAARPIVGNFAESEALHPMAAPADAASAVAPLQLFGDVWSGVP